MNGQRKTRLASWIGSYTPDPRQAAILEERMNGARSWLWHGEKKLKTWRIQRATPTEFHPLQAG